MIDIRYGVEYTFYISEDGKVRCTVSAGGDQLISDNPEGCIKFILRQMHSDIWNTFHGEGFWLKHPLNPPDHIWLSLPSSQCADVHVRRADMVGAIRCLIEECDLL